jgi:hypothetical protein
MTIEVLRTKIHRVRVTEANLDYIGSITIDEDLIDAVGLGGGRKGAGPEREQRRALGDVRDQRCERGTRQ